MGEEKESTNTKYTKSCVMILMFIILLVDILTILVIIF